MSRSTRRRCSRDASAAVLPDAHVTATNNATGLSRATDSGPDGRFVLPALPVGTYTVVATRQGFAPLTVPEVVLTLGAAAEVVLDLAIAGLETRVTVAGEQRVVAVPSSAVASVVSQAQIDRSPTNDRAFIGFALTTPGVAPDRTPQQGASAPRGSRSPVSARDRTTSRSTDSTTTTSPSAACARRSARRPCASSRSSRTRTRPSSAKHPAASSTSSRRAARTRLPATAFCFFRDRSLNAKGTSRSSTPAGRADRSRKAPYGSNSSAARSAGRLRKTGRSIFGSFERIDVHDQQLRHHRRYDAGVVARQPVGTRRRHPAQRGIPGETGQCPVRRSRRPAFLGKSIMQIAASRQHGSATTTPTSSTRTSSRGAD